MGNGASGPPKEGSTRRSRKSFFGKKFVRTSEPVIVQQLTREQIQVRAVNMIIRNVRAWKTRRNCDKRIARKKKQQKEDKARRQSGMFKDVDEAHERLMARRAARMGRGKAWNETVSENAAEAEAEKARLIREAQLAVVKTEEAREDAVCGGLEVLAAREAAAYKAGHKSPHLLVISECFPANKQNIVMYDVANAYEEAALEVSPLDQHPVKIVRYDYEMSSLELLGLIRDKITEDDASLLARTISFIIPHAYGALLPLKHLPSTEVGILGGVWKDGKQVEEESQSERIVECQAFWETLTKFLSAYNGPEECAVEGFAVTDILAEGLNALNDPAKLESFKAGTLSKIAGQAPITTDEKQYDRSKAKINFILGAPLGTDGDPETGKRTMAAVKYVFHGADVQSPSDFTKDGKALIHSIFDPAMYEAAKQLRYKNIRIDKFGYDPKDPTA